MVSIIGPKFFDGMNVQCVLELVQYLDHQYFKFDLFDKFDLFARHQGGITGITYYTSSQSWIVYERGMYVCLSLRVSVPFEKI